jgi:hypothetical protein
MPGFVLHQNAVVQCAHGGQARPTSPIPRGKVSGMPVTTQPPQYVVIGCPIVPPPIPTCVTASWITASLRVMAMQQPVLLFDSQAVTNNGSPLVVMSTQTRVKAM